MEHDATTRPGRPRSAEARRAVLHAVDDLLEEVGYAAMTMKGIAVRAGVGRQTVYRWWSTKAEVLLEASAIDARGELAVSPSGDRVADTQAYAQLLVSFLTSSQAGHAYRALLGEAQHDAQVRALLSGDDVLLSTCRAATGLSAASATLLVGPIAFWIMSGQPPSDVPLDAAVEAALAADRGQVRPPSA